MHAAVGALERSSHPMGRTAERLSGSYRGRRAPIEGDSCPWRAASCRRWGWARKPIEKAPAHCLGPRTAVLGGHGGRICGVRIQIDGFAQPAFHPRSSDGEAGRGHVKQRRLPSTLRSASAGVERSQKATLRARRQSHLTGQGWRPAHRYASDRRRSAARQVGKVVSLCLGARVHERI
jgi:hypothetical protein